MDHALACAAQAATAVYRRATRCCGAAPPGAEYCDYQTHQVHRYASAQELERAHPPAPGTVRVVCVSDTHLAEAELDVPCGDVLVHCGDWDWLGHWKGPRSRRDLAAFGAWLRAQPCTHKVVVAGNHDAICERLGPWEVQAVLAAGVVRQWARGLDRGAGRFRVGGFFAPPPPPPPDRARQKRCREQMEGKERKNGKESLWLVEPTEGQDEQWREANRRRQRQTIRYRGLVPKPPTPRCPTNALSNEHSPFGSSFLGLFWGGAFGGGGLNE